MASITKLPSGNFRALVRLAGSKPQSATFSKKSEAVAWAKAVESKHKHIRYSGAAPVPAGSRFGDFLAVYVDEVGSEKEFGRTKKATLKMLERELGSVKMEHFSENLVREFVRKRMKSGAGGVTISADLSYISGVLRWVKGAKGYDVDTSIARNVRSNLPLMGLKTRGKERDRVATDAEIDRIISAYGKRVRQKIDMPTMIRFALATSMRLSEITGIRVEDFDIGSRSIIIRDRKDPQDKIGNDQVVPLLPDALDIVISKVGSRKSGKIFGYEARSVSASFTRITTELGIQDLRFHDLRHTAITRLFRLGLTIELVAILSGHKDWKTLRRYTHLNAQDVHAQLERIASGIA